MALADQHGWLAIIWLLFAALIALLLYHYLLVRKADSKVLFVLTFVPVSIIVSAIAPALTENVHFPLAFPLGIEYPTVNVVEIGRYLYPTLFLPLFVGWPLLIFIASRQLAFSIPNPPFRVSPILLAIPSLWRRQALSGREASRVFRHLKRHIRRLCSGSGPAVGLDRWNRGLSFLGPGCH